MALFPTDAGEHTHTTIFTARLDFSGTVALVTSGTLVPVLHFWSFPSNIFKINLNGTVWYVQKINKVLTSMVIVIR